jgi:glutamyl-tRNA reductase
MAMDIRMAGIDYTRAGVEERERFTFTSAARVAALKSLGERYAGVDFVIVATCNRTELWACAESGDCPRPEGLLRELKNVESAGRGDIFVSRAGREAVEHLFYVASGLKSQITGENQILSQIKEAAAAAREAGSAGSVLQRLFQSAITSAKRVKTETNIMRADVSVASSALAFAEKWAKERGFTAHPGPCLVIGSGVAGRLCAELFAEAGADVTMTLRRRKSGKTVLPKNAAVIDYDERYPLLAGYRIVISATVSPHHTITHDEAALRLRDGKERLFLDLAMPRDIDPGVKKIKGVNLFDIDEINGEINKQCPLRDSPAGSEDVKKIIDEGMADFIEWSTFRVNIETVRAVRNEAAADIARRLHSVIKNCARDSTAEERLNGAVTETAGKVMDKLLFGLRDNLDAALWADCFAALRRAAEIEPEALKERA